MRLRHPGIACRFAGERRPLPLRRVPPVETPELVDLVGEGGVDLGGALRERVQELGGHAGDLGLSIFDRPPDDSIAVRELGPQHRLVQAAQCPLVTLEVAGVQRHPAALRRLDLGGDDDMGV